MPEWNPNLSCMAKISSSETKDHNSTSLFFISYHHAHCSWHICPARITTYRPDKQRYHSGQISDVMWCDMISKLIQLKRRRRRKKACLQMVAVCTLFHCKGIWFPKALIPFQFITEPLLSQRRKSTLLCKFQRVHENDIYSSRRNKINVGNLETERFSSKQACSLCAACMQLADEGTTETCGRSFIEESREYLEFFLNHEIQGEKNWNYNKPREKKKQNKTNKQKRNQKKKRIASILSMPEQENLAMLFSATYHERLAPDFFERAAWNIVYDDSSFGGRFRDEMELEWYSVSAAKTYLKASATFLSIYKRSELLNTFS